jgi:hypothetical protein
MADKTLSTLALRKFKLQEQTTRVLSYAIRVSREPVRQRYTRVHDGCTF